jgi:hypothetical protein
VEFTALALVEVHVFDGYLLVAGHALQSFCIGSIDCGNSLQFLYVARRWPTPPKMVKPKSWAPSARFGDLRRKKPCPGLVQRRELPMAIPTYLEPRIDQLDAARTLLASRRAGGWARCTAPVGEQTRREWEIH